MISHPHQCIFVHIPKTAGNSINRVFGVGWEDHKDLQRYREETPPELFGRYFKFAVVRNPWDRMLSDYNYQRKKSREKDSKLFVFTAGGSRRNFAEWVEMALGHPDLYEPQQWGGTVSPAIHRWSPQVDWISVDGRPAVDFVARLERLPQDFRQICRKIGLAPTRLPHRNRRLHWHYSHYYNRSTRDLVASYYARDIEYFGYEFEESILRFRGINLAPARVADIVAEIPAVVRPRPIPSWPQRSYAVALASLVVFIGAWTAPLSSKSADPGGPNFPVGAAAQETFSRVLRQTARQSAIGTALAPLAEIRRLTRTTPGLHLSVESFLPGFPGTALIMVMDEPRPRLPSASWPAATPEDRPPARPRGWFTRQDRDS